MMIILDACMLSNKKTNLIIIELFLRGTKLNISLIFTTQSYFSVSKNIRAELIHYFIMKIANKRDLQQITVNHSSNIDFKFFTF